MAGAVAVSRGLFAYEEPVADIWPEFAAQGKGDVTVGEALSEQAGLAAIDFKLTLENIGDERRSALPSLRKSPIGHPAIHSGNHAYTLGWIASELIHRRDPACRRLPQFFAEEIAVRWVPMSFLGYQPTLTAAGSHGSTVLGWRTVLQSHHHALGADVQDVPARNTLQFHTLNNPLVLEGPGALDCEAFWSVGQGAAGGMASARGMATLYQCLCNEGGQKLGVTPEVMTRFPGPSLSAQGVQGPNPRARHVLLARLRETVRGLGIRPQPERLWQLCSGRRVLPFAIRTTAPTPG